MRRWEHGPILLWGSFLPFTSFPGYDLGSFRLFFFYKVKIWIGHLLTLLTKLKVCYQPEVRYLAVKIITYWLTGENDLSPMRNKVHIISTPLTNL